MRHPTPAAALAFALLFSPHWLRADPTQAPGTIAVPLSALLSTGPDDYTYSGADRNTAAIQRAIDTAGDGSSVLLPPGHFVVRTIWLRGKPNLALRGAGRDRTTLRRAAIQWDNDASGPCPHPTEVLFCERCDGLTLADLTLDGNGHHMAIKGPGRFGPDGRIVSGTPQFPKFAPTGGTTLYIGKAEKVVVEGVAVRHGYRWAVAIGQVKGLDFRRNLINTGNLSTDFRGHWDGPPGTGVQHAHTSQDGLHLINVEEAQIRHNTIHSEDSALALEANPNAADYTFPGEPAPATGVRGVRVHNNAISTNSPAPGRGLLTDRDRIYGTGLAERWVGQGGIDIFYTAGWDLAGRIDASGDRSLIQNIQLFQNAVEGARYGVRANFFLGADAAASSVRSHRIRGLDIFDNHPRFRAGVADELPAGFRNITRNDLPGSWNQTGGVGVAIRFADGVAVRGNEIADVRGGTGVELVNVTQFRVVNNDIRNVRGRQLAADFRWDGGEGVRVWNSGADRADPRVRGGAFDAGAFEIAGNRISNTASYGIFVTGTANGTVPRASNRVTGYAPFDPAEQRGLFVRASPGVVE